MIDPGQLIRYTLWESLFDIDRPTEVAETWQQLTQRFSQHRRLVRKNQATGFGPYRLGLPPTRCYAHKDGQPRDYPHRCDDCVTELTLLVYDADAGNQLAVDACDAKLASDGIARLWYTSFSHGMRSATDDKVSYRLIIPIDQPVAPELWAKFRSSVLYRYGIPADPKQCSGKSHFYFVPSCPDWATPAIRVGDGRALPVTEHLRYAKPEVGEAKRALRIVDDYVAPDDPPATDPDWGALRTRLQRHTDKLVRNSATKDKARWMTNLLAGKALDEHGRRNYALLAVAGILAYVLPGEALSTYCKLLEPSMEAMIAAGTSNTWGDVERMLLSAMRCKYIADKRDAEIKNMFAGRLDAIKARIR